jgi:hypothetical protein
MFYFLYFCWNFFHLFLLFFHLWLYFLFLRLRLLFFGFWSVLFSYHRSLHFLSRLDFWLLFNNFWGLSFLWLILPALFLNGRLDCLFYGAIKLASFRTSLNGRRESILKFSIQKIDDSYCDSLSMRKVS